MWLIRVLNTFGVTGCNTPEPFFDATVRTEQGDAHSRLVYRELQRAFQEKEGYRVRYFELNPSEKVEKAEIK